jgi:hypothetical protein
MLVLIDNKVAEYQKGINDFFWLVGNSSGLPINIGKEKAMECAMDYHETEGCKVYLELYPAPEKGEWNWLAQDGDGCWYGYKLKPIAGHNSWATQDLSSYKLICESPPNPFWRKTLR